MKIELQKISVREVISGYKDSAEEGVVAFGGKLDIDRKSTRLNSSHIPLSRMPSSA